MEYIQSICMKLLSYESNLQRFRINYLPPVIVLNSVLTSCCRSLIFQTLISLVRWCITDEENNNLETSSGPKIDIYRVVASHQTTLFAIYHHYASVVEHVPKL